MPDAWTPLRAVGDYTIHVRTKTTGERQFALTLAGQTPPDYTLVFGSITGALMHARRKPHH